MVNRLGLIISIFLCFSIVSCRNNKKGKQHEIAYINHIVKDTSCLDYHIIHSYKNNNIYASIAVVGDPSETLPVTNELMYSDNFDNIDGKNVPDGLPDFSGETIQTILDVANSPYYGYISNNNVAFLRQLMVKNFINSLDTNYFYSPFDKNQIEYKKGAKLVILASTYASVYGAQDIDTLCVESGTKIPVLNPVKSIFNYIKSNFPDRSSIPIWTTKFKMNIYDLYKTYIGNPKLNIYSPEDYTNLNQKFLDFLDVYLNSGNKEKLDYIIVDDSNVSISDLNKIVENIEAGKEESQLAYRNILSDDFQIVTPAKALAYECYRYLRKHNDFSHKISLPEFKGFLTCVANNLPVSSYRDDGSFTNKYKYGRIAGKSDSTWFVVAMRGQFVSDSLRQEITTLAPKLENEYVHE